MDIDSNRFRNALQHMKECLDHMDDEDISSSERKARGMLINICCQVSEWFVDEDDYEEIEDH